MFESHERHDAMCSADPSVESTNERNIGQHFRVLMRRKWQFLICAGLIFGTAMVVICTLPSRYDATSVVGLRRDAGAVTGRSAFVRQLLGRKGVAGDEAQLVTEPHVLAAAARKVAEAGWPTVTAEQVAECTDVDGEATRVRIRAEAGDPKLAARIANALATTFAEVSDKRRREEFSEQVALHRSVMDADVPKLRDKIKQIEQWELENGLSRESNPLEKIDLKIRRLRDRQGDVANNLLTLKARRQALMALAAGTKTDASYDALGSGPEITRLRREISDLQQRRSEMGMAFKPGHPQMKLIDMRTTRARRDLILQQQRVIGTRQVEIDQESKSLREQAKELAKLESHEVDARVQIASVVLKHTQMQDELTKMKSFRDGDLQVLRELDRGLKTMPKSAEVISPATPARVAIYPPRLWYSLVAAGFSLLFGLVLAFSLEHIDRSIRTASEAETVLRSPVVGVIPKLTGAGGRSFAGRCRVSEQDPHSMGAEAYRLIRSSLQFGLKNEATRTILVTSSLPGEGKTTTASNLAISLAASGKRVCLVEADLRQPRLCYVFETTDAPGLSDVLSGRCDRHSAIRASGVDNLDLLVAGPVPGNPAEMLESSRFGHLLKSLADDYDHVILDSPPVLAVTDAQVVAAQVDQTLLVVEARRHNRCNSKRAIQWLDRVHASVAGVVLNSVLAEAGEYESQHVAYQRYVTA